MKKPRCGNSDRVYTSSPDTCTFLKDAAEVESEVELDRRWKKLVLPTGKVFFERWGIERIEQSKVLPTLNQFGMLDISLFSQLEGRCFSMSKRQVTIWKWT